MAGKVETIPDKVEDSMPFIKTILSEYGLELTSAHYPDHYISRRIKKRHFWDSGWEDMARVSGSQYLLLFIVDKAQLILIKAVAEKIASKTNLDVRIYL